LNVNLIRKAGKGCGKIVKKKKGVADGEREWQNGETEKGVTNGKKKRVLPNSEKEKGVANDEKQTGVAKW
jgi:hypothetical protein